MGSAPPQFWGQCRLGLIREWNRSKRLWATRRSIREKVRDDGGHDIENIPDEKQQKSPPQESSDANIFRKKGDVWEVGFRGGTLTLIKESRGMAYIAHLLANPHKDVPSIKLAQIGRTFGGERHILPQGESLGEPVGTGISACISYRESQQVIDSDYFDDLHRELDDLETARTKAEGIGDYAEADRCLVLCQH